MMRIAFVHDTPYPWQVGGVEMLNNNEIRELAKRHEVHLFTTRWPGMPSGDFEHNGAKYHARHDVDRDRLYRHGRRSIREAIAYSIGLFRLFRYDFDVVICNYFPVLHIPVVWLYCRLRGAKMVMEVAEVWDNDYWLKYLGWPLGGLANLYSAAMIRFADSYVCISSTTAGNLAGSGVAKGKIRIFNPCIDDAEVGAAEAADGVRRRRIIFSGRLIKEKRLDKWLRAVKAASERMPGVEAVIIGDGPELKSLRDEVRWLGLSRTVKLRPFYKDKESLYREIRESSLMLHMSEREGFGIVCVESIALGTPVVLPSYTPIPAEVRSMCVVRDEEDLPAAIVRILKSKDKSAFIRNGGNLKKFLISKVNDFYGEIFRGLGLDGE
jgi:glycosyltransferase involved in cell wall biosynthesis